LRKAFGKYDKKKSGSIKPTDIADVFRMAGQNPTNNEASRMIEIAEEPGTGMLMFNEMLPIIEKFWRSYENYADELKEACIGNKSKIKKFVSQNFVNLGLNLNSVR
jgi:Ca2+-binding EF-hand superfamily protein